MTIARRSLIRLAFLGSTALPLVAALMRAAHAEEGPPVLDINDPTAKTLEYVTDATKVDAKNYPNYKPGQKCSNCSQWQGEPADKLGGCELVLGQYVLGEGWCKVWEQKKPA